MENEYRAASALAAAAPSPGLATTTPTPTQHDSITAAAAARRTPMFIGHPPKQRIRRAPRGTAAVLFEASMPIGGRVRLMIRDGVRPCNAGSGA